MASFVLLDSGVVGLLCSPPRDASRPGRHGSCLAWLDGLDGRLEVLILDLVDFEVRRELLRLGARRKLARLDGLHHRTSLVDVSREAWRRAAEFWAFARRAGLPTAGGDALDGDAVLAGVAASMGLPGDEVVIATTNVRHLARFPGIDARTWEEIP